MTKHDYRGGSAYSQVKEPNQSDHPSIIRRTMDKYGEEKRN